MRDLARRLARLESSIRDAENQYERTRLFVVWEDDPLPEGLRDRDWLIRVAYAEEEPQASRLERTAEYVGSPPRAGAGGVAARGGPDLL